jgi:hypothetical protein
MASEIWAATARERLNPLEKSLEAPAPSAGQVGKNFSLNNQMRPAAAGAFILQSVVGA